MVTKIIEKSEKLDTLPIDKIICGDCIKVLNDLPEKSIDLIFADPPYNLQLRQELYRPNMTKVDAVNDKWDQFKDFETYDDFTKSWLAACRRVLKDTGTIWVIGSYHNIFRVGTIIQDLGYWILNDVIWLKTNPMPNFRGVRFTNAHETLIWAQKKQGARYTFNHHEMKNINDDLQMRSDWTLAICSGAERIKVNGEKAHSTQKPEALLYRVILASSNPGDIVLDPFFGSGTTGAVAKKLHRHWIGIEKDEKYIQIAQKRIDEIEPALFDTVIYESRKQKKEKNIPFGSLLEVNLVQPGQILYYDADPNKQAVILSSGHIKYGETSGSIHQIGTIIKNAPCNGWEHWYYQDKDSDQRVCINELRDKVREQFKITIEENTHE